MESTKGKKRKKFATREIQADLPMPILELPKKETTELSEPKRVTFGDVTEEPLPSSPTTPDSSESHHSTFTEPMAVAAAAAAPSPLGKSGIFLSWLIV